MTNLNEWLKNLLANEYGISQIKEEYGNLIYNNIKFALGENNNKYLLYKYAFWYYDGKNHSFPLVENYDCQLLRDIIHNVFGLEKKEISKPIVEEKSEDEEFTGGLFDLL